MYKKRFALPYMFWILCGTLIPLGMIFYYGFTDRNGMFTLSNVLAIFEPVHRKALGLSLILSLTGTLVCFLIAFPLALILTQRIHDFYICFADVDEFFAQNYGLAGNIGKGRNIQYDAGLYPSAEASTDKYPVCHSSRYGIRFSALYGTADLQCSDEDR